MNVPLSHLECQQEAFIVLIGLGMKIAASALPPPLLQIVREPLKPGIEAAFNAIEVFGGLDLMDASLPGRRP
jgi:hypothetical protein